MKPEQALREMLAVFPFREHITPDSGRHTSIATIITNHLKPGARLLDFGSGACDKTAMLQMLGMECYACDDLQDAWHIKPGVQDKIAEFAKFTGVRFTLAKPNEPLPYDREYFDAIVLMDVLEHLHESPRNLLNMLLEFLKPEGLLIITVPSAANIRKRLAVMRGKSNYPKFDIFYWYPGPWRGHIREYVKDDLQRLSDHLGLDVVELRGCDFMIDKVKGFARLVYLAITGAANGCKDSWVLVARKREGWQAQNTIPEGALHSGERARCGYGE